jgi:hypothetical protein
MRFADIRKTYLNGEVIPVPDPDIPETMAKPRILADTVDNRALVKEMREQA